MVSRWNESWYIGNKEVNLFPTRLEKNNSVLIPPSLISCEIRCRENGLKMSITGEVYDFWTEFNVVNFHLHFSVCHSFCFYFSWKHLHVDLYFLITLEKYLEQTSLEWKFSIIEWSNLKIARRVINFCMGLINPLIFQKFSHIYIYEMELTRKKLS